MISMKMPGERIIILSIIIPLYNVEMWLSECLNSLLSDAGDSPEQLEIILYDDASTDRTPSIAASYVDQFPDCIRYTGRSVNYGPGSARNEAFALARGTYTWFFDGDDKAGKGLVRIILANCQDEIDLLFLQMNFFDTARCWKDPQHPNIEAYIKDHGDDVKLNETLRNKALFLPFATWRYVFKTSIMNGSPFCPTTCTEDLYFHFKVLMAASTLRFVSGSYVLYRRRRGQLTSINHVSIWSLMSTFRYIRDDIVEPRNDRELWNIFLMRFHSKLRNIHRKYPVVYTRDYRSGIKVYWREVPLDRQTAYLQTRGLFGRLEMMAIGTFLFPFAVILSQLFKYPYRILAALGLKGNRKG